MNLRGIRRDLANACGGRGFTLYDHLPADLDTPAIIVKPPDSVKFAGTLAGGAMVSLVIVIVLGRADDDTSQDRLDELLSGGLVDLLRVAQSRHWLTIDVLEARNIRTQTAGATEVLTCDLAVDIITTP